MNNEQFDRLLQEKMANHQIPPPPHVWSGIEKHMSVLLKSPVKKFRRSGLVLLLIALLTVPVVYYFVYLNSTQPGSTPVSHPAESSVMPENNFSGITPASSSLNNNKSFAQNVKPSQASAPAVFSSDIQSAAREKEHVNTLASDVKPVESVPSLWMSNLNFDIDLSPGTLSLPAAQRTPSVQNLSFVFTTGPMLTTKLLTSKYQLAGDERYIAFRRQTEQFANAWTSSLLLQADLTPGFFIRTGILHQTIQDNIWLRYIRVRIDGVISDTIVGSRNQTTDPAQLLAISDDDYTLLADYVLKGNAWYRLISIPVLAGGQIKFSKYSFYATAGLSLHFNTIYQGRILAPDSAFLLDISQPATSPFDKIIGFTLIGTAGVEYFITPKFSLLVEPAYYYQIPDMTKINYRLSQRFRSWSLQSGLRYRL